MEASSATISKKDRGHHQSKWGRDSRYYHNGEPTLPWCRDCALPTKVQGEGASSEVVANIQRANQRDDLDVLIIGRGGGSIEDLWAFNEEAVVRAIFESRIPIISSVGHETDTTLADFVADRRAATPTAAAELATPVTKLDLLSHLQKQEIAWPTAMSNRLAYNRERLAKLSQSVIFRQPERLYDGYLQKI